jgi:hypothetical protein
MIKAQTGSNHQTSKYAPMKAIQTNTDEKSSFIYFFSFDMITWELIFLPILTRINDITNFPTKDIRAAARMR